MRSLGSGAAVGPRVLRGIVVAEAWPSQIFIPFVNVIIIIIVIVIVIVIITVIIHTGALVVEVGALVDVLVA